MAVGTPIVSTNCNFGPSEILANGKYGKLVKEDDVNEMAESIEEILLDKRLADHYVKLARQRVKDFEVKKIVKEYEKIIDKVYEN